MSFHHHEHGHLHSHHNHSLTPEELAGGEKRLVWSILLNLLISLAEVIGGVLSGSLALLSDALHNFSDTASLAISLVTLRVSQRSADRKRTYGYRRAQILGAFVNLITLVLIALYLIYEAVDRYLNPQPINGAIMLGVATIGLAANLLTAWLLFRQARHSLNIRSAFVHIVSDAVSSVGVVVGGLLILQYELYIVDALLTVLISVYILFQSAQLLRHTARILMQSTPYGLEIDTLVEDIQTLPGVTDMHHVHVWQLDERHISLEAHVVINQCDFEGMESIKQAVKRRLQERYQVEHSTLEFEFVRCDDCHDDHCYEVNPNNQQVQ